ARYILDGILFFKAYVLAARDQLAAARACGDEGLALTEKIPDGESAIPGLFDAAWASFVIGEEELASRLVARVYPLAAAIRHRVPGGDAKNTPPVIRAGRAQDWLARHTP